MIPKLMVPLCLLHSVTIKSIKNMDIESTNMIGVKDKKEVNNMKVVVIDNSDRLRGSIREASIMKFLPQEIE